MRAELFHADRRTGGRTGIIKLTFAFRNFGKAPKKHGRPGSSVGIAINYGLDGPGIESRWGEIFRMSRPALGPTQPPVQWVPGLSRGVKHGRGVLLTTHPLLVPWSCKSRAIPLPTLWATTGPVTGTLYFLPKKYENRQSHSDIIL